MIPQPSSVRSRRRGGFTLLEAAIGASIFSIVGYGLVLAVGVGQESQKSILTGSIENKHLRKSALTLSSELRSCSASNFLVTRDDNGQAQLDFQVPITNGGAMTWGVYDKRLGQDWDEQNREDWSVRYLVETDGEQMYTSSGDVPSVGRRLVRQLLDDKDKVQLNETVVDGLKSGFGANPGFSVVASGDMWNVTITLAGQDDDTVGHQVEFDVWMHN